MLVCICRTCLVHFNVKEEDVQVSVWSVCVDSHGSICGVHSILFYCSQHIWRHFLVIYKFLRKLINDCITVFYSCKVHKHLILLLQVPSSCITYRDEWCISLFLRFFLWEDTFDQAVSEKDMGRLHWRICCHHDNCFLGQWHLFSTSSFFKSSYCFLIKLIILGPSLFSNMVSEPGSSCLSPHVILFTLILVVWACRVGRVS